MQKDRRSCLLGGRKSVFFFSYYFQIEAELMLIFPLTANGLSAGAFFLYYHM